MKDKIRNVSTVKDLIELLSKIKDQDAVVYYEDDCNNSLGLIDIQVDEEEISMVFSV